MPKVFLFFILIGLSSCANNDSVNSNHTDNVSEIKQEPLVQSSSDSVHSTEVGIEIQKKPSIPDSSMRINTFRNTDVSGFGYDILIGEKLYIHQPNIPSMPGNNGFDTEEEAKKVAELVLYKIRNKIMPPSVERKELDSLGIY